MACNRTNCREKTGKGICGGSGSTKTGQASKTISESNSKCAEGVNSFPITDKPKRTRRNLHREISRATTLDAGSPSEESQWTLPNGVLHRKYGPAKYDSKGNFEWYDHGKLHRKDGPAVNDVTGEYWLVNGQLHRDDGPAEVLSNGLRCWYKQGTLHRTDGPARDKPGSLSCEYWVEGKQLTSQEFNKRFPSK